MKNKIKILITVAASLGACASTYAAENAPKSPKTPKYHLTFEQADVDHNGGLTVFEFATTQGPGVPMVEIRRRFLGIDVSGALDTLGAPIPNGLITQGELITCEALEEKPKSDLTRFELADFDGDGLLSPVEFGYLVSQRVPVKNILRQFNRLDINDNGFLSKEEFQKPKSFDL